jgi:hypothetical protein
MTSATIKRIFTTILLCVTIAIIPILVLSLPALEQGLPIGWYVRSDSPVGTLFVPYMTLTLVNGVNENVPCAKSTQRIVGPTASFSIGGFVSSSGFDGQFCYIRNTTSQTMTINNFDAGSSAVNQVSTETGSNISISGPGDALFVYSTADGFWHIQDPWPPAIPIRSGNTFTYLTVTGPLVAGHGISLDSFGNAVDSGFPANTAAPSCSVAANCDLTGNTIALGPLTVLTAPVPGRYLYHAYLTCASGTGTVSVVAQYTDELGPQTSGIIQPFTCGTNISASGTWPVFVTSAIDLQYYTRVTGTVNYNVHVWAVKE